MKKNIFLLLAVITISAVSCRTSDIKIEVTSDVINPDYLGNGVEWDPYDEAEAWGSGISDEDWNTLFKRLDFMRPQYIRCMINSRFIWYDPETGGYNDQKNSDNIEKLLSYCQKNDIMVIYGEYNPPVWDMKDSQEWVEMSVKYLNRLVVERGFDCIKYFVTFNEPDGNWSSTNGDYDLWRHMMQSFSDEMGKYPELDAKVSLAGPDAVLNYHNRNSEYDTEGWVAQTAADLDDIVGLYDIHAYPGQKYVRNGKFAEDLKKIKAVVPEGKQIVFGEAGYKYHNPEDSALKAIYDSRVAGHPYTKGTDCNMLVYDRFYALDMPLFLIDVMNGGFSGAAAWMLDDAMHSSGDSGKTEDIKIWGMWNILGEEVFGDASQEDVRPWYWTWSMMCRSFPAGTDILKINGELPYGVRATAALTYDGKQSVALVNFSEEDVKISLSLAKAFTDADYYVYRENPEKQDESLCTEMKDIRGRQLSFVLPASSFGILTEIPM